VRTPDGGEPVTFYYSRDARVADASEVKAVVHRHNGSRNRARADDAGTFEWPTPPAWQAQGACKGKGKDPWFPPAGKEPFTAYAKARIICMSCPVRVECATFALDEVELHGMWGGTTPMDRRRARLTNKRAELLADVAAGSHNAKMSGGRRKHPLTYGERAVAMKADGWAQHEIAAELKVAESTVSKWLSIRRGQV